VLEVDVLTSIFTTLSQPRRDDLEIDCDLDLEIEVEIEAESGEMSVRDDERAEREGVASGERACVPNLYAEEEEDEPTQGGGAALRRIQLDPTIRRIDEPAMLSAPLVIVAGGFTDEGTKRPNNEDAMLLLDEHALYVVADGMGGHAGGEVASQLAVDAMEATFLDHPTNATLLSNIPVRAVELVQGLAAANEAIRGEAARSPWLSEMGTTIVAALFCPENGRAYVAHVGDSRCYRLREGELEQVTTDHTLAEFGITGREANRLSRAVGSNGIVEVDLGVLEVRPGDTFLLCSDGITKALSDDLILGILQRDTAPLDTAAQLIARANALRARDNVTAVVVRVGQSA
jgi:serine/threonine protein phosphatase PrpC